MSSARVQALSKSKLIELLALADIRQNRGCVIMDPHGDLTEELSDIFHDLVFMTSFILIQEMSIFP